MTVMQLKAKLTRLPALPRSQARRRRASAVATAASSSASSSGAQSDSYWTLDSAGVLHTPYSVAAAGTVAAQQAADAAPADFVLAAGQRIVCGDAWLAYDATAGAWTSNKPFALQESES